MSQLDLGCPQIDFIQNFIFAKSAAESRHFREVTYAISYLHGMDPPVVHRDLKLGKLTGLINDGFGGAL